MGPFLIWQRIGKVAYCLALPPQFAGLHDMFHVSMVRKYESKPSHVVDYQGLELREDVSMENHPMQILDKHEGVLRNRVILMVKIL